MLRLTSRIAGIVIVALAVARAGAGVSAQRAPITHVLNGVSVAGTGQVVAVEA